MSRLIAISVKFKNFFVENLCHPQDHLHPKPWIGLKTEKNLPARETSRPTRCPSEGREALPAKRGW